jgi:hypothetical protein
MILLSLLAALSVASAAHAGVPNQAEPIEDLRHEQQMRAFVAQVLAMTGLHNDVAVVIDPGAEGCAYATTRHGKQYIGVDPGCVGPLATAGRYNWRAVGILCHEIGHLLGGHTTTLANSHREESEADEWAGWAMARLGSTLPEAQTVFGTFSVPGSKTHPPRTARLASVACGWRKAQAEKTATSPVPPGRNAWERFLRSPLPWASEN